MSKQTLFEVIRSDTGKPLAVNFTTYAEKEGGKEYYGQVIIDPFDIFFVQQLIKGPDLIDGSIIYFHDRYFITKSDIEKWVQLFIEIQKLTTQDNGL